MIPQSLINATLTGNKDSDRHLLTIFSLVLSIKAKRILELGVKGGNTTQALLLAAYEIPGATVTSVDSDETLYRPPRELEDIWKFARRDALDYLGQLPLKVKFDFVLVDDWHAYRHVKEELACLDMHVTPSSLIIIHDTMYGNTQPVYHADLTLKEGQWAEGGPYRAVAELNPQFWEFSTIPSGHGLTILRKKYTSKFYD